MYTLLIVLLILLLVGSLPAWPYSGGWGFYPSGGLGLLLFIFVILMLTGRLGEMGKPPMIDCGNISKVVDRNRRHRSEILGRRTAFVVGCYPLALGCHMVYGERKCD